MASKKELEARIAALEAEVARLKAQKPTQPGITWPHWPPNQWPYSPGSGSISSTKGQQYITWNTNMANIGADAVAELLKVQRRQARQYSVRP